MENPGLSAFSAPTTTFERPPNHPIWDEDPDYDPDDPDNDSDYVPSRDFGRWRTPGQSIRVPTITGPSFRPDQTPSDVIHGEVISPEEQDSAARILRGEHDSDRPSENPYVEHARQNLKTPGSSIAVETLSGLLKGGSPADVGDLDEAHDYLIKHFTGVRVNPRHGVMMATSPYGSQLVKRQVHLPAVRGEEPQPFYSLTNKHGVFNSEDPNKLVRTMVAFQIIHNEIGQNKKDDDDQSQDNLSTTSGFRDFMGDAADWLIDRGADVVDTARGVWQEGKKPLTPLPKKPPMYIPPGAKFEPGFGTDKAPSGKQTGGYVIRSADAPHGWYHNEGIAYSPGHSMRMSLDPVESMTPRPDPRYPGHSFTYARNDAAGYIHPRRLGNTDYWVDELHPAARGEGFDLRSNNNPPAAPPAGLPAGQAPIGHFPPRSRAPRRPPPPQRTSAAQTNDLCPVCASGYLEPYDNTYHECLNCGSLVKHIGFEKQAARRNYEDEPTGDELDDLFAEHDRLPPHPDSDLPAGETMTYKYSPKSGEFEHLAPEWERDLGPYEAARPKGGLGRGLKQIQEYEGDPLGLASGGSENPEFVAPEAGEHPLKGEENQTPEEEQYRAKKRLLDREAAAEAGVDPLEEHLGKLGFQPMHKPGHERMYVAQMPRTRNGYIRLHEGVGGSGWVLSADHVPSREIWMKGEDPYNQRNITVERQTKQPGGKPFKQPLPDPQDRTMAQKSILAVGHHPIEDDALNRAIRDVSLHGRDSETYQRVLNTAYEPPAPLQPEKGMTQRDLRGLSSVSNPGLGRFII
ncbi:MAG TPA: hypothetical protein VIY48_15075 [Candidatus Paceibacterota bacterium]